MYGTGIKEIDADTLASWLAEDREAVRLVDVRSPSEFARGVIPGAEPLPLHLLPLRLEELASDPRRTVLYCRSGSRSAQACRYLAERGRDGRVWNLRGGILDWARRGYRIALPAGAEAVG